MMRRRTLLGGAGGAALIGATPWLASSTHGQSQADDYRALVVLFLSGGCDGHNLLVPTDAMYGDYQTARQNLALPAASLVPLAGRAADHAFGVHPALRALAPLYEQQRLAFIANAGPLVQPTTPEQAKLRTVDLPPFLFSHSDQVAIQQGWTVTDDTSGWAGRALELLPSSLRNPLAAVSMDARRTLVKGRHSRVTFMPPNGARYWGTADLARPETESTQSINRMAKWQFANAFEAEYARSFGSAVDDQTLITRALLAATPPQGDFGSGDLANKLRSLASLLPVYRSQGLRRQVILVQWGQFDTHANQRGSGPTTQDAQFAALGQALAAFDEANRASGLDMSVVTLMMSDFGRTVRPGSGGGSEHAWGNHWFALGGPVQGGTVHGVFPSPVLGGADDSDRNRNGRHVPSTSSDQVGATVMKWLGLDPSAFHDVFPNLANFERKTIPLLRA